MLSTRILPRIFEEGYLTVWVFVKGCGILGMMESLGSDKLILLLLL